MLCKIIKCSPSNSEGQGSLACSSPRGSRESDMTMTEQQQEAVFFQCITYLTKTQSENELKDIFATALPSYTILKKIRTVWTSFKLKLATVGPISSCGPGSDLEYICSIRLEATDGNISAPCPENRITCFLFLLWGKKNQVKTESS